MERILRANTSEQSNEILQYVLDNSPDAVSFWEAVLKCMSPFLFNSICIVIVASNLDNDEEYTRLRYLMDADQIDAFFGRAEQLRYHANPECRKYVHDNILLNFSDATIRESQFRHFQRFYARGLAECKAAPIADLLQQRTAQVCNTCGRRVYCGHDCQWGLKKSLGKQLQREPFRPVDDFAYGSSDGRPRRE